MRNYTICFCYVLLLGLTMHVEHVSAAVRQEPDFATMQKAAARGDANAQTWLGSMYESGRGVAKDERKAVEWYRKAANQGNAVAQNNLGIMYMEGRGVAKDDR